MKPQTGSIGFLFLFIIFLLLLFLGLDYGYIFYQGHCPDKSVTGCLAAITNPPPVTPTPAIRNQTIVAATDSISVTKYTVTISMNIPLEGGTVTGSFSGDCSGTLTGTYAGGDNSALSGSATGSCTPLLVPVPASATFTGTVNQATKTVPVTGTGGALGVTGSRSLTLTY